jgi:hypothetical protein
MKKTLLKWLMAVVGFGFAIGFGLWAQVLFTQSELVHFSVNFPGKANAQTMACCELGGSWTRTKDPQWNDYPAGGVLAYGEEGVITIDVGKQGFLKRTLQPNYLSISSHWMRNVGTQPYQIRLDMDLCGMELEWETFEADWDQATLSSTRAIEPGNSFNMDWFFHIPPDMRAQSVVCDGQLTVFDAQSDELLTELPIRIVNSQAG